MEDITTDIWKLSGLQYWNQKGLHFKPSLGEEYILNFNFSVPICGVREFQRFNESPFMS